MKYTLTFFASVRKLPHLFYFFIVACLLLPAQGWAVIDTSRLSLVDPSTVDVSILAEEKQTSTRIHSVTLTNSSPESVDGPIVVEIVSAFPGESPGPANNKIGHEV